ncbi:class III extradiol dioxygenase subunit B-like domain-containing protein [Streptomyces zagrosensis]|uniref:Extradiol ring-cleavage dioxygenase class III enzyme subunit B domain-containing protein n=1 Tax=Streptomyces zagrosensis TaxID=1042984 RepID=A0A7W9QC48_9ACTN|nr:class III extradiol dioxygenase subunit B-like domain-containing protein [Streptomyces zagrosensis]MBB5937523.1 hypothetical protein [Streptomyces zagrosensis]
MLVAAAVCPCPPLLVPEVAAGATPELAQLRNACSDAISVLAAARPDRLIVLGPTAAHADGRYPSGAVGSFRNFGVDLTVRLATGLDTDLVTGHGARSTERGTRSHAGADTEHGTGSATGHGASHDRAGTGHGAEPDTELGERGAAEPGTGPGVAQAARRELPLSLATGSWLLGRARWSAAPAEGVGVAESLTTDRCTLLGRELAASAGRVALLVSGDGSARRTLKAPGYFDERAAGFDAEAARALGAADTDALTALPASLAHELLASGRAPWQVLAGAGNGAGLRGELLYDEAPYGVGYFVATWS